MCLTEIIVSMRGGRQMPFVKIGEKNIYYEEYGKHNKNTIVYFHGGPGESCLSYTHQAEVLGENYHVISFDQYGVLRSDAIPENQVFGVKDHAQLIEKMRKKLGINSWTVLGHSYGGMLASHYVHTYSKHVDSVIYDCPTWNIALTSKTVASFLLPYFEKIGCEKGVNICNDILNEEITSKDAFDKAIMLSRMMQEDEGIRIYSHVIDPHDYQQYNMKYIPQINTDATNWGKFVVHTQKLMEQGDFYKNYLPNLKDIKVPSLLLVGKYDLTCGKDQQDYFCKYSHNGYIVEFQNSAHLSWIQEPQAYTKAIIDFLDTKI